MISQRKFFSALAVTFYCLFALWAPVYAGTPMTERIAVEAGVKSEVTKDLAMPYNPQNGISGRTCLDGRPVADFQGDIVEYWADLECPYCIIKEPVQAQRNDANICIVVRHVPASPRGDSMKKALSYEALKQFSVNAANLFWDEVVPKTTLGLPAPYEAALLMALQEAAISPEEFTETLSKEAAEIVSQDVLAAQSRISSTPTYILEGIRFSACDFKASELPSALELAKQARKGDEDAKARIIKIITNGVMNETML
ncbi:hypothetical protein LJC46_04800 [Desulfovibrio sp. OttesenSCG-928-G15]|nr:hypothetical protein [Desulfovibrio sp. OttesenSCG-928-G15]